MKVVKFLSFIHQGMQYFVNHLPINSYFFHETHT